MNHQPKAFVELIHDYALADKGNRPSILREIARRDDYDADAIYGTVIEGQWSNGSFKNKMNAKRFLTALMVKRGIGKLDFVNLYRIYRVLKDFTWAQNAFVGFNPNTGLSSGILPATLFRLSLPNRIKVIRDASTKSGADHLELLRFLRSSLYGITDYRIKEALIVLDKVLDNQSESLSINGLNKFLSLLESLI